MTKAEVLALRPGDVLKFEFEGLPVARSYWLITEIFTNGDTMLQCLYDDEDPDYIGSTMYMYRPEPFELYQIAKDS